MNAINENKIKPTLSVIIPVYNAEFYLEECIESIFDQGIDGIEVICIDDGSSDNSLSVLNKIKQKHKCMKVVTQKNAGVSAARNRGINLARGEYITFVDSDDMILPDTLCRGIAKCLDNDLDVLFYSYLNFFDKGANRELFKEKVDVCIRTGKYPDYVISGRELLYLFSENNDLRVSACVSLIRKSFLDNCDIAFVEGMVYEDALFVFQLLINAKRAICINEPWYRRRLREGSIEHSEILALDLASIAKGIIIIYEDFCQYKDMDDTTELVVSRYLARRYKFYCRQYYKTDAVTRAGVLQEFNYKEKLFYKALIEPYIGLYANYNKEKSINKSLAKKNDELIDKNKTLLEINEGNAKRIEQQADRIRNIRASYSFRIGKMVTKPFRILKK